MRLLLCTDGSPHATRALELGAALAQKVADEVHILSVTKHDHDKRGHRLAESTAATLETVGVVTTIHRRVGKLVDEVVQQAHAAPYDLVVIGSRGRRGLMRLLLGSVALRVTEHAPASVLVVKGRAREIRHLLICSAAGPVSERTIRFASRLALPLSAAVTLIHVMSQLPLASNAILDDLEASAEELIRRGSREGAHLSQMLSLLTAEGVKARAVVRHGLVLDEILNEAQEGSYDLLVVGAHITPGLRPLLVDDLCADILLSANRPVLVVR